MKRVLLYIGIALAVIGCAKDEMTNNATRGGEINFSAGVATRVASDDDCEWAEGDEIGIFTDQSGEDNRLFTISDTESGAMSGDVFYTLSSGARTYYAYHPYSSEQGSATTISIDCTSQDELKPLLWATATSNNTEVSLQFSHMYAKVTFSLAAGGVDVTSLDDAKAWLVGANTKATFDIASGEFAFSDESASDISLAIDDNNTITAYLPPCDAVSGNVKLWINAQDNTFVKSLTTEKWESGNEYAYDIVVGEQVDILNNGDNYFVYTAVGLWEFADLVNGGNTSFNCTLMGDIDLGDVAWTPMGGDYDNPYSGIFDGGNHVVSGLSVTGFNCAGLFGCIGNNAKISNLGIDGSVRGYFSVGGVVGSNDGGTITNCHSKGSVSGDSFVGGVNGYNGGTLINCYNTSSVKTYSTYYTGGVVGHNYGTTTNCYNLGSVDGTSNLGGVVGLNNGTLTNSYNTGSVDGTSNIGGVVGVNDGAITNCYWDSDESKEINGVGEGDDATTAMTTAQMQDASFAITLNNNAYDYNNPTSGDAPTFTTCAWVAVSDDYPILDFDSKPESEFEPEFN